MNAIAFLICALALRPVSFPPIHDDAIYEQFSKELAEQYRGREVWFVKGRELPSAQFERIVYVKFRGYAIYVKKLSSAA